MLGCQANKTNRVFANNTIKVYSPGMKNRIREFRERNDWSQQKLADLVGTSQTQIDRLEKGQRRVSDYWLEKLARGFNCSPLELISDNGNNMVPVVGHVGAGARVLAIDDHMLGAALEEVSSPIGYDSDNIVAVRVRGDSMQPMLEDGWLLFYTKEYDGVPADCVGRLCIVKLHNGEMLVKKIRMGSQHGLYHLISHNADPLFDQPLEWAARVIDIRPS